jgi:valyl-tRNA synthetase
MVMFGLYCHGDVPFRDVYIHAVIQDGEGRPMKKSLGNGVDPVDIVESHGADALRFTLASTATETQDIRIPVTKDAKTGKNTSQKFEIGRNFANKIWNASRFILMNISDEATKRRSDGGVGNLTALEDRWILSRLNGAIRGTTAAINEFRIADVATGLYQFFWSDLCDWYLEIAKARIKAGDAVVQGVLVYCLETALKLLHPVMPFVTEEIWSKLPGRTSMLVDAPWPALEESRIEEAAESQLGVIQAVTSAIREIQNRYPAAKGKDVVLQPRDSAMQRVLEKSRAIIEPLANVKIAENSPTAPKPENAAAALVEGVQIFIGGVIDKAVERVKLEKRKVELAKHIQGSRNKLGNEAFVSKAPANIIQGLRDQLTKQEEEAAAIEKNLVELT